MHLSPRHPLPKGGANREGGYADQAVYGLCGNVEQRFFEASLDWAANVGTGP